MRLETIRKCDNVDIKSCLRTFTIRTFHLFERWLLDGFPRTIAQAEYLWNFQPVESVINLHVPHDVIIERVKDRWVHLPSGRVYNLHFNKPKVDGRDDVTGEELVRCRITYNKRILYNKNEQEKYLKRENCFFRFSVKTINQKLYENAWKFTRNASNRWPISIEKLAF